MCLYTAGESLEFPGESFIREEGTEADVSGEGRPDAGGDQGSSEEEEKSPSTDQQTLKSEVCLIKEPLQQVENLFNLGFFASPTLVRFHTF